MKNLEEQLKNSLNKTKKILNINPHRHWLCILYFFVILFIVLLVFSFYLFYKIKTDKIFRVESVDANKKVMLKEKLLDETRNSFLKKEESINKLKTGEINFKDPSR